LRHVDAGDVLRRDGAADVQAVVVVVEHVAERHAVERVAHLALIEPAHRQARAQFVATERIGALQRDPGKPCDRLQRRAARRQDVDRGLVDGLLLADLA